MRRVTPTTETACPPHHRDCVAGYDAAGRYGQVGTCRKCGDVRFYPWPQMKFDWGLRKRPKEETTWLG